MHVLHSTATVRKSHAPPPPPPPPQPTRTRSVWQRNRGKLYCDPFFLQMYESW